MAKKKIHRHIQWNNTVLVQKKATEHIPTHFKNGNICAALG